jgi:hypothetical protein
MLRFKGNMGNLSLLTNRWITLIIKRWKENGDRAGIRNVLLVGVTSRVLRPRGLAWLHRFPVHPEHRLAYGSGKAHYSLVVGFGSFRIDWLEARKGRGLSIALRPGLKCGGLESKFGRRPEPLDRSGMGWFCLCLGYKRGVYFLEYPAELHWFTNRRFYVTVLLGYGLTL